MKRSKFTAIPVRGLRSGGGRPLPAARGTAPPRPAPRSHFTGEATEALRGVAQVQSLGKGPRGRSHRAVGGSQSLPLSELCSGHLSTSSMRPSLQGGWGYQGSVWRAQQRQLNVGVAEGGGEGEWRPWGFMSPQVRCRHCLVSWTLPTAPAPGRGKRGPWRLWE